MESITCTDSKTGNVSAYAGTGTDTEAGGNCLDAVSNRGGPTASILDYARIVGKASLVVWRLDLES